MRNRGGLLIHVKDSFNRKPHNKVNNKSVERILEVTACRVLDINTTVVALYRLWIKLKSLY